MQNKIYIILITLLIAAFTVVFNFFPRSTFSELEKRELAQFPAFSVDKLAKGEFTDSVSIWFSDSEPYRDKLMALSMGIRANMAMFKSEDEITFHAAEEEANAEADSILNAEADPERGDNREIGAYTNKLTAKEKTHIAHSGIIIYGKEGEARALMSYGGRPDYGTWYSDVCNKYKEVFGPDINIYCLAIPTAVEFYCPDNAKSATKEERPTINTVYSHLADDVKAIDAYTALANHADEDIFLRTDHHWAPLGAYYAAKQFAKVAGVPFIDLSEYDKHVIHNFVGSMYGYSKDIIVKKSPEDFVYWTPPARVEYETTYIKYNTNKNYDVIKENPPEKGEYFYKFPDGSSGAYCTFMGGDSRITQVRTNTKNGRRMILLKDSYGNAIPGYLFGSFEEIHVIDWRYFAKNLKNYVKDHKITDIVVSNSIFAVCSPGVAKEYERFLTQPDGIQPETKTDKDKDKGKDKGKKKK